VLCLGFPARRSSLSERSKNLDYTCYMRMSSGLLGNSLNRGGSPRDVAAIVLQEISRFGRWIAYPADGRPRPITPRAAIKALRLAWQFSRPYGHMEVEHGLRTDQVVMVADMERISVQLGLASGCFGQYSELGAQPGSGF